MRFSGSTNRFKCRASYRVTRHGVNTPWRFRLNLLQFGTVEFVDSLMEDDKAVLSEASREIVARGEEAPGQDRPANAAGRDLRIEQARFAIHQLSPGDLR